ncbi:expressed protein [Phakopsora pachyrhizi]|uniref:Expressed protein n=1 Tax=Phakopsora pachyrhizi TaxID=170000 RepID=A0AAV0B3T8_PHAPC|nr:expressed protein [Phakopsora pachyrhizi]
MCPKNSPLLKDEATMSVPHEQKPEITEAAAGSDLRLRSREQAESSSKYTPTRASNEDSELHDGIAELGNELIDQPRQQESNKDVVFSEAPMQIVSVCTGWHEGTHLKGKVIFQNPRITRTHMDQANNDNQLA